MPPQKKEKKKADRWESLGEFIRNQRRLADLSIRQLSEVARVSNPYLSQVERGIYKPSGEILKSIADALHISAETLFAKAGLLEQEPAPADHPSVEEAIKADARLSTDQKRALIEVYRNFAGRSAAAS